MKRYDCLKILSDEMSGDELVLVDMGNVSTELHAVNHRDGNLYHLQMGIPFGVGLGLALALPDRRVIACQGDGSLLENLGVLVELAQMRPENLLCIVWDNECYEAVGGHPTGSAIASLAGIGREAGVPRATETTTPEEFAAAVREALAGDELSLIVAKIEPGIAEGVRPMTLYAHVEGTIRFVQYVERTSGVTIARPDQWARDEIGHRAPDARVGED